MTKLVFTIDSAGGIEGLLKDKAIDTSKFGERAIKRITEINHHEPKQKFYINWLRGPFVGLVHSHAIDRAIFGGDLQGKVGEFRYFDTYEDAVEHEIKCVNAIREAGHTFV